MAESVPPWHVLQLSDVLDLELASALADFVPVILWEPKRSLLPRRRIYNEPDRRSPNPSLRICGFPILRGFARFPLSLIVRIGPGIAARLTEESGPKPDKSPLICTAPYFAPVAELWRGPVIYWLTDYIGGYRGASAAKVCRLDRRMCASARLVCPNSERLALYLVEKTGCDPAKIQILPNAARKGNLLQVPPSAPSSLPSDLAHLARPVAGVIGNLAENMDWLAIEKLLELSPQYSWGFVGSTSMRIDDKQQRRARQSVMAHPRACLIGHRPYGELYKYARGLDVAILPYFKREPNFSGSSTRYYEHLAACRPMIAFPGVHELLSKRPLLRLANNAEEAATILDQLLSIGFDDGLVTARWKASRNETWHDRAAAMQSALQLRKRPGLIAPRIGRQ